MNSSQSSKYTPHEASLTSTWLQRQPSISKLRPEEEALIGMVRDEWLRIGLATGPVDREAAQAAISDAYREVGFEPPRLWIWLGSPKAGVIAFCCFDRRSAQKMIGPHPLDDLLNRGGSEVRDQVREQIEAQIDGPVGERFGEQIGSFVRHQVVHRPTERLQRQLDAYVTFRVSEYVRQQIRFRPGGEGAEDVAVQIEAHIRTQLWGHLQTPPSRIRISPVDDETREYYGDPLDFGGCGPYRLALVDFYRRIGGIRETECLHPIVRAAAVAGWWWPFERACIVTERPTRLLRDAAHRLHCSDGPALLYPDGWAIYAWHGVPIHGWFVEDKQRITPDVIEAESNAELRRVLLEIFGFDRYIEVRGARLIAENECLGLPRQLFELDLKGERVRVLRVVNGTVEADGRQRQFHLSVPLECNTPHEAVAWSYGRPAHLYKEAVRT